MPRPLSVSIRRISIRPSTRFKQLPVYLSAADLSAWLKLSPVDADALVNASPSKLFDGIPKISKWQLQTEPYADLIKVMQRHPSPPSIRRIFRAEIEKILSDKTHPQYRAFH
ncbi:MAG: hypothetical protein ABIU05_21050, partial [Nitrospirales bacterium]